MKLKQCSNGHYYDEERYGSECPHCKANGVSINQVDVTVPIDKTVGEDPDRKIIPPLDDSKTEPADAIPDAAVEPAVGWLVCIRGNNLGRDYTLHSGRNFVGRGGDMDVSLSGDMSVSRSNHAIIVYDSKSRTYLAQPGDSKELFYLNGKVVLASVEMFPYDTLEIGKSNLLFIPLCGKEFDWTNLQNNLKEEAK